MGEERRESTGGSRITRLALGVVGLIAVAAGAYAALRAPLGGTQTASSAAASPGVAMQTVTIPVEGMSCGACAARIKKTLKPLAGVGSVEVSLERRNVLVRYQEEKTTPERLAAVINELGYKASLPVSAKPQEAQSQPTALPDASASEESLKLTTFPVRGMACESCVETVTGLLKRIDGVKEVSVSLKGKEARVRYVEGKVTPERLAEEVTAQGFESGPPSTEGGK